MARAVNPIGKILFITCSFLISFSVPPKCLRATVTFLHKEIHQRISPPNCEPQLTPNAADAGTTIELQDQSQSGNDPEPRGGVEHNEGSTSCR